MGTNTYFLYYCFTGSMSEPEMIRDTTVQMRDTIVLFPWTHIIQGYFSHMSIRNSLSISLSLNWILHQTLPLSRGRKKKMKSACDTVGSASAWDAYILLQKDGQVLAVQHLILLTKNSFWKITEDGSNMRALTPTWENWMEVPVLVSACPGLVVAHTWRIN